MEAGALWLLVVALAVGPSGSSAQYLGLCESSPLLFTLQLAGAGGPVRTARGGTWKVGGLLWA